MPRRSGACPERSSPRADLPQSRTRGIRVVRYHEVRTGSIRRLQGDVAARRQNGEPVIRVEFSYAVGIAIREQPPDTATIELTERRCQALLIFRPELPRRVSS